MPGQSGTDTLAAHAGISNYRVCRYVRHGETRFALLLVYYDETGSPAAYRTPSLLHGEHAEDLARRLAYMQKALGYDILDVGLDVIDAFDATDGPRTENPSSVIRCTAQTRANEQCKNTARKEGLCAIHYTLRDIARQVKAVPPPSEGDSSPAADRRGRAREIT